MVTIGELKVFLLSVSHAISIFHSPSETSFDSYTVDGRLFIMRAYVLSGTILYPLRLLQLLFQNWWSTFCQFYFIVLDNYNILNAWYHLHLNLKIHYFSLDFLAIHGIALCRCLTKHFIETNSSLRPIASGKFVESEPLVEVQNIIYSINNRTTHVLWYTLWYT